ncbi:MAG: hypothetical protein JXR76_14480, partial [Deltaproteobacteria bacterium]|nr:hypothetical protein [Deltaproteobacteria bacterium]
SCHECYFYVHEIKYERKTGNHAKWKAKGTGFCSSYRFDADWNYERSWLMGNGDCGLRHC